ncbi:MAG: transcriptional repressor [Syntrophales bacterium]|nr:transcriptional repressor [Syntrophales bacterium]MDD5640616.1 transcriptional repressor [Syntrophales bacterium]
MADSGERLQQLIKVVRGKGHRLTPQRLAMLKVIAKSEEHPSAEEIYDRIKADFPTTSLATIYKTLSLLKDMGEVLELSLAHVGCRYDGNKPYPHPHVICTGCGQILDPEFGAMAEIIREMAQQTGYQITHHQLNFFGLCPRCQQEGQAPD